MIEPQRYGTAYSRYYGHGHRKSRLRDMIETSGYLQGTCQETSINKIERYVSEVNVADSSAVGISY